MTRIKIPRLDISDYPDYLYRVHLSTSHTLYHPDDGFRCGAEGRIQIDDYNQLAQSLKNHLTWNSGEPSHFISMFGDYDHAAAWAGKRMENRAVEYAQIMTIDPHEIKNIYDEYIPILSVSNVVSNYPSIIPRWMKQRRAGEDEFLALYRIPETAIIGVEVIGKYY